MVWPPRKRVEQLVRHQRAARVALGVSVAICQPPEPAAVELGRLDAHHRDEAAARVVRFKHGYLWREQHVVALAERHRAVGITDRSHALFTRGRPKLVPHPADDHGGFGYSRLGPPPSPRLGRLRRGRRSDRRVRL